MVVFRYLSKQVFSMLTAITVMLVTIFVCNSFLQYLTRAAEGRFAGALLFKLIALMIPYLLSLLMPLGFFLGVLISYGRMYYDSEMTVLEACGFSRLRLLWYTMIMAFVVSIMVTYLSFWVSPWVRQGVQKVKVEARSGDVLQLIMPGQFMASPDGTRVFYIERMTRDRKKAENVFMAVQPKTAGQPKEKTGSQQDNQWGVLSAQYGVTYKDKDTGDTFAVAENGYRYYGVPGAKDYKIIKYDQYGVRIAKQDPKIRRLRVDAMPTAMLLKKRHDNPAIQAELQWRISLPLSVIVMSVLAVPLSRVNPRSGRFTQLIPAILVYIMYANLMFVGRVWVEKAVVPVWLGMWWLHVLTLIAGILLWVHQAGWRHSWFVTKSFFKPKAKLENTG